jgi:hypothetical protein
MTQLHPYGRRVGVAGSTRRGKNGQRARKPTLLFVAASMLEQKTCVLIDAQIERDIASLATNVLQACQ